MLLTGKNAIVTGGGSGIGRAIAESLAGAGCRVAITGRDSQKLREVAEHWQGQPAIEFQPADVSDRVSLQRFFEWARATLGVIDILVISAGINVPNRALESINPEEWDEVLKINATGAFNCMYAVMPEMRARQDGLVINISSVAGKRASDLGGIAYCAAKFAQTALGTAAAMEVGHEGVRVTNIYPGEVDTPILKNRPVPVSAEHRARMLQPQDVAHAVLMIATLPKRAHVAELVIKPTWQTYA